MIARDIIVIGGSAGGFEAIQKLVSQLPPDLEAAIFITLHLSARGEPVLPDLINRFSPLPAAHPWEETPIEMGRIYVAPPDHHLIVGPNTVYAGRGPKENLQRPCINTMFRSAAVSHGQRVAGVLLTGMLDDGSAGLWEIQQRGGVTIVQDPEEAPFPSMPESAIRGVNIQYIVRLGEMPSLFTRLTMGDRVQHVPSTLPGPTNEPTTQACPECGGVMKMQSLGRLKEFNCHVGHRFGLKTMIAEKTIVVERALWTALSQSEELSQLLEQARPELDQELGATIEQELQRRRKEQELIRRLAEREDGSPLA